MNVQIRIAAALLALGSAALIGWTVVSLASKPAGEPRVADASPATVVARPVVAPPGRALRPSRTTDRGLGGKAMPVRRAPSVQPSSFAAPARPSVTASEAPAPPAPSRVAEPPIPTAPVPAASSDDDEPQPGEQESAEPQGATPAPRAFEEPVVAPPASADVSSPAHGQETDQDQ